MDSPSSSNYTLGKGTVSFNQYRDGAFQGYRDLGNAPALTMSIDISKLDHFSSRAGIRSKDKSVIQEVTPTLSFGLDEVTDKNFAMSLLGLNTSSTQAALDSASSAHTVGSTLDVYETLDHKKIAGFTYIKYDTLTVALATSGTLTGSTSGATGTIEGVFTDASTSGVVVLSGVTDGTGPFENNEILTDGASGSVSADGAVVEMNATDTLVMDLSATLEIFVAGTDYMVNCISGEILYKSTGSIIPTDTITIAYQVEAGSFTTINMLQETEIKGSFHFVSDNASGSNYELELWDVTLTPDGELSLIGDDWLNLAFSGEILKDEALHPAQPYGRMIMDVT